MGVLTQVSIVFYFRSHFVIIKCALCHIFFCCDTLTSAIGMSQFAMRLKAQIWNLYTIHFFSILLRFLKTENGTILDKYFRILTKIHLRNHDRSAITFTQDCGNLIVKSHFNRICRFSAFSCPERQNRVPSSNCI